MPKGKIIFVEDDLELLETFSEFMTMKGFEVTCTECALDFFQALIGAEYDVAIVDIGLPDKSGFEVVEHVRKNTNMGIIVLTALDSMSDKMRGYNSGADLYFTKPIDLRELAAAVSNLINRIGEIAPASPEKNDPWRLDPLRWTLESPPGGMVKLTKKETNFLQLLIAAQGAPVSRNTLLKALDYQTDEVYSSRALAVMVTRLRNKIREQTGLETPITAVRSRGYSFSAQSILV